MKNIDQIFSKFYELLDELKVELEEYSSFMTIQRLLIVQKSKSLLIKKRRLSQDLENHLEIIIKNEQKIKEKFIQKGNEEFGEYEFQMLLEYEYNRKLNQLTENTRYKPFKFKLTDNFKNTYPVLKNITVIPNQ